MNNFERKNIEKLQQGDLKTLEYVFHLYSLPLTRYAYRFVEDEERAKDMVQEVFYKLWKDRKNLCINTCLEAFLYTCVKNECLNHLKHERIKGRYAWLRRKIRNIELQYYDDYGETCEQDIRLGELRRRIHEAIESLPDKSRKIFKMSRFEEKKNKEIAKEMNISLKTVEKHITQALKKLREHVR
ncbi:MAG: RNA polymerase sigma-70 factor [Bacteroidota bacterium]